MKKVESKKHFDLRQEVGRQMRLYLGQRPQEAFQVALELTDVVARHSPNIVLQEWVTKLHPLTEAGKNVEHVTPMSTLVTPPVRARASKRR